MLKYGAVADFRGDASPAGIGEDCSDAMSCRGAFGRRMPPSRGGDCDAESRGMGNVETAGELKDDEGTEPDDASETASYISIGKKNSVRRKLT